MKTNDGYWMTKKHLTVKTAGSAYEAVQDGDTLRIIATPGRIYGRGQTLGGPNFKVIFSSPRPDIIGVRISHFGGVKAKAPDFELERADGYSPEIEITEHEAVLRAGESEARVSLNGGWSVRFYSHGRLMTSSGSRSTAIIEQDAALKAAGRLTDEGEYPWSMPVTAKVYTKERLSLETGEKLYGLGERFGPLVRNGQSIDMWNADGGTCSELSYKNVPFYLSSRGYGVFIANPGAVSLEVASEVVSAVSFAVPENTLEYYFIGGGTPKSALINYIALTGRPSLPPAYTFGLWLTTSFTTSYDEKTVTTFIDGMAERDIPLSVFHFDCFWMREFRWCDFEWDSKTFPDPDGMIKRLKERGLHLCVWVNPYVSEQSPLFDICAREGYFIHNTDGDIYQSDEWQPGMAIIDFTNPAAREWYKDKIRALAASGIDCIKTDFGERIPSRCVYYDGSDSVRMHNFYSYLYNKAVAEALGDGGCLFARSATAGGQKFPVHWGGDCSATYQSMAETLRGGLSLCASGFGFFSHDISGFEATATPDIYKRWSAFGLLSTHSRLHGSGSYRVPWLFDEEAVDVLRHFVRLKGRLMPYIYTQAVKTCETGLPSMRPMMLDFADERPALDADMQYMLGDSLLVAPIFNERGEAEFYVPNVGVWYDLQTNEAFTGGRYYRRVYDYYGLPLLVRPASIVVLGAFKDSFDYDYSSDVTVIIGALEDGQCACCDVVLTSYRKIRFAAKRNGGAVMVICDDEDVVFDAKSVQGLDIR